MPDWISSAITAGAGLVSSLLGFGGQQDTNSTNLQAVRETNQANRELAEYQYEKNVEQWNRENEYNTPAEQMKRLAQAGLNPHLVYGNGNAIQPSAKSPQYEKPQLQTYHQDASPAGVLGIGFKDMVNDTVNTYLKEKMQIAQINKMYWDNEKTIAETQNIKDNNPILLEQLRSLRKKNRYQDTLNTYTPDLLYAQALGQAKTNEILDKQSLNLDAEIEKIKADTVVSMSIASLNEEQKKKIASEIAVNYKTVEKLAQDIITGKAEAALLNAQLLHQNIKNHFDATYGPDAPYWIKILDDAVQDPDKYIYIFSQFMDKLGVNGLLEKAKIGLTSTVRKAASVGLHVIGAASRFGGLPIQVAGAGMNLIAPRIGLGY